ncbi:EF-hand domain-containing protein [Pseudoxanthomonas sp.]|uniref:EF-hand domain-containing protein n=1 Tax=Pseudoxanthomonas sp. TaxID=1871049 RepID=UPI0025865CC6|nr:EF-hand domain-containing protein [Pseudoxanthomonas sp.]MCR6686616.1 EF-hand domain-containing protein [Pseudoxanthomonas sp.]
MNNSLRLTSGLLVLGMLAAAPLAFAQSTTAQEEAAAQKTQPTSPTATGAAEQQPRQAGASGQGLSWADLDADGNGNLSLQEATRHQGLSSVFTQADTDGDGELTADEYRGYIQKQQAGGAAQE